MATTAATTGDVLDLDPGSGAIPLLLLHGWTGSKEDFAPVVERLAAARRVLVPDLPGHGSCPPAADGDYSLGAHVRWLLDLLADRGVRGDVHVLGHSHGGLVAQRLAAAAAHRVTSLALVGTGLGAVGDATRAEVVAVARAARDRGVEAAWATSLAQGDGGPPDPVVRARFLAMPAEAIVGVARNVVVSEPLGAFLRGVDFPVLVCHGEDDTAWTPAEQQLLARRIAGARYAIIPDAQHCPATENPEGLLALLEPFLVDADARAARLADAARPRPQEP
jgi:pimeloyl-ACP methyl ester carboxylesterase